MYEPANEQTGERTIKMRFEMFLRTFLIQSFALIVSENLHFKPNLGIFFRLFKNSVFAVVGRIGSYTQFSSLLIYLAFHLITFHFFSWVFHGRVCERTNERLKPTIRRLQSELRFVCF